MKTEIKQKWFYSQSPEEVWLYLTDPDLIALWLMPNDFKPVLGHDFTFRINPVPSLNLDGIFHCKVLEIIPSQKLIYSWMGKSENNEIIMDTIVEWTLEKKENGTELHLLHTGFKEANIAIYDSMTDGWMKKLGQIANLLNER